MPSTTTEELKELAEKGDVYALMMAATLAWLAEYHPAARYAILIAEYGPDLPSVKVPVIPASSLSSVTDE